MKINTAFHKCLKELQICEEKGDVSDRKYLRKFHCWTLKDRTAVNANQSKVNANI